jgi:hypothetical protein
MYLAEVIVLNDRPVIRIRSVSPRGKFLVGYFGSIDTINDQGRPVELADLLIEQPTRLERTDLERTDLPAGSGGQRNTSASACDGVLNARVCRGRSLSSWAMASRSAWLRVRKSSRLGRY